jgi:CarD family transcriptional regulator
MKSSQAKPKAPQARSVPSKSSAPAKPAATAAARPARAKAPAKAAVAKPATTKTTAKVAAKSATKAPAKAPPKAQPKTQAKAPAKPAAAKPAAPKPQKAVAKAITPAAIASRPAPKPAAEAPAKPAAAASPAAAPAQPKPHAPAPAPTAAAAPAPASAAARPSTPQRPAAPRPALPAAPAEPLPQFAVGDHVVYPTHGVGRVTGVVDEEIAGHRLTLIVIEFEENRMVLRVPVQKARSAGLRKLSTRKAIDTALATLKGRARVKRTMWSRRAQEYEAKINSGDPVAIAEVVRDLHRNAGQPDQSFSERQIYEQAMDRLAAELAAIDGVDKPTAQAKLATVLKAA